VRYLSTLLVFLICAIGCQGPISDWPSSKGGDDQNTGSIPVTSPNGGVGGGAIVPGAVGGAAGSAGGTTVPPPMTGTPGGSSAPLGGTTGSGTGTGAVDAGAGTPSTTGGTSGGTLAGTGGLGGLIGGGAAGGSPDAGAPMGSDAGVPSDAGASDGGAPDGGAPDGGAHDGGCTQASTPDASMCPGYGCRTTLQQLRTDMKQGACSSEQAAAVVCDGRVGNVALQCTQENVFALNIPRAVNGCLKRDAQIGMLSNACIDCFVDEALCTLTRCFAACTVSEGSDCRTCRQQQCSAMFASCSGLPAPSFGP
jgi:hypothetical protein